MSARGYHHPLSRLVSTGLEEKKKKEFKQIGIPHTFCSSRGIICFLVKSFIDLKLIYSVAIISAVQQSDSVIHVWLRLFFDMRET